MDRLVILAPALAGVAFVAMMFGVYCVMCATGRTPKIDGLDRRRYTDLFGPFLTRYILWLIRPIERALLAAKVSPNALTCLSLAFCGVAGVMIANNHLATATWAYALAGVLDILDGRLARRDQEGVGRRRAVRLGRRSLGRDASCSRLRVVPARLAVAARRHGRARRLDDGELHARAR